MSGIIIKFIYNYYIFVWAGVYFVLFYINGLFGIGPFEGLVLTPFVMLLTYIGYAKGYVDGGKAMQTTELFGELIKKYEEKINNK